MSKQAFVEALSAECANYNHPRQAEMAANLLDTVSSDIYSESQRFVFELIQNADDSSQGTENEVYFDFYDNYIVVSHNGKPFTEADIRAITSAGASEKEADPTKTGYKGIGFKSVFGKSNWVGIFSDGYNFRFEKAYHQTRLPWQVIPIWTEGTELDSDAVKYLTQKKYQVSTVIYLAETASLQTELEELLSNAQILLFLRRVAKISVSINGVNHYTISKTAAGPEAAFQRVSLWKDTLEISTWLVKRFDSIPIDADTRQELKKDDKTPLKLKEAEFTEIAFAARVESDRIRALKGDESLVFTYLPTKVADFAFPFLVNGSFLTNAAREALHEDRIWNQWLIGVVATKLFDWLQELAQTSHRFEILHLLPPAFAGSGHELKRAFATSAAASISTQAFIPSNTLSLKQVSEVVIDDTGLASLPFLSTEAVVAFVNDKTGKSFDPDSFANRDLQQMHKLRPLGATFFDADNLEQFFLSDAFTASHQVEDNHALIEYFFKKATKFDSSGEWNHKLKLIPFIYSDDEELKSPATICFPSLSSFQTEFGETVSVINPTAYAKLESNADLKNWLESLGVKEPSDTAYLENEIIGNIEKCITKENFQKVTRYLFNQNKKGVLTKEHLIKLQDLHLFCTNDKSCPAKECYLSDFYGPLLKLENIHKLGNYVSDKYKQTQDLVSEWKTFFIKIGVSENISSAYMLFKKHTSNGMIEKEYFEHIIKSAKVGHQHPHLVLGDKSILFDKIRYSHYANKYEFSKLFWEQALISIDLKSVKEKGLMEWGHYQTYSSIDNYFYWYLENAQVFPTTQKTCLMAKEVFVNQKDIMELAGSHLPVFDYKNQLPDDWKPLLNFKKHLELDDYLKILDSIAKAAEENDGEVSKTERKRIGLVYNKLALFTSDASAADKAKLHVWSTRGRLLSITGQFETASKLKWIKREGFSVLNGSLKPLYVPENCDVNNPEFSQLLTLLQIHSIEEFQSEVEASTESPQLKARLINVLPYLALLIEKRTYKSAEAEFTRMREVLSGTTFFSASAIYLSFSYQGETHRGQAMNVFQDGNGALYFKGNWRSPLTIFNLLRELSSLLKINGLNEELRVLLELPIGEIPEWLLDIGVPAEKLGLVRAWIGNASLGIVAQQEIASVEEADELVDSESFNVVDYGYEQAFCPEVSASEIDLGSVQVNTRTFLPTIHTSVTGYSEIKDQGVRFDVGRWSEELIHSFFVNNKADFSNVEWQNEDGESGKPYDFKVVHQGTEKYIEVKGTPSSTKDIIYMSKNEWQLMFEQGEKYEIYRVTSAGTTASVKIDIIPNPSSKIKIGELMPTPIQLQV